MLRKNQRRLLGQGSKSETNVLAAQANSENSSTAGQDVNDDTQRQILELLQNISRQLAQLQAANNVAPQSMADSASAQGNLPAVAGSSPDAAPPNQDQLTNQLQQLFSQLLLSNKNGAGQKEQQRQNKGLEQVAGTGQGSSQSSSANEQQAGENSAQLQKLTAQTAAQVLAQAQYELANELEASLQKLKQVIRESEQIANKISNLLGEENSGN